MVMDRNLAERISRREISGIFIRMGGETIDQYLKKIHSIAKKHGTTSEVVADMAVSLANSAAGLKPAQDSPRTHVGFYLFSGEAVLLRAIGTRVSFLGEISNTLKKHLAVIYVAATVFSSLVVSIVLLHQQIQSDLLTYIVLLTLCLVTFIQSSIAVIDTVLNVCVVPGRMYRMSYPDAIPDSSKTLVVMPILLSDDSAASIAEKVESNFLKNDCNNIYFCVLSDLPDAKVVDRDVEFELLSKLANDVSKLNRKHCASLEPRFIVIHRFRVWNSRDDFWMGWERKRGKILELNDLIQGQPTKSTFFSTEAPWLNQIKYVFTIDNDTEIPDGSVHRLVEISDHPLNTPQTDGGFSIARGYSIVQPRINLKGNDPLSSCYQFGSANSSWQSESSARGSLNWLIKEGVFCGKGLYNVAAFSRTTRDCIPKNLILSHDVLEGGLAKAAYAAEVFVMENSPMNYLEDMRRWHRWMRGDWQNLIWLLRKKSRVRTAHPEHRFDGSDLSFYSKWKIVDNVRRNLSGLLLLLLLIWGWMALPRPGLWTLELLFLALFLPVVLSCVLYSFRLIISGPARSAWALRETSVGLLVDLIYSLFCVCVLPLSAAVAIDAILRSSWRVALSKKKILAWRPSSAYVNRTNVSGLICLALTVILALAAFVIMRIFSANLPVYVVALLLVWSLGPMLIWLTSLRIVRPVSPRTQAGAVVTPC